MCAGTTEYHTLDMILRNFILYGMVGVIATPAHYLTLILLVEAGGVGPVFATSVGSFVGAVVNYFLNYHYTFNSSKAHLDAGPKFFTVALSSGILNAVLVYLGADLLGRHYLPVQVCATLIVFLVNFVLNSAWTFREEHAK
jgi:putative flippase GtrA